MASLDEKQQVRASNGGFDTAKRHLAQYQLAFETCLLRTPHLATAVPEVHLCVLGALGAACS